MTTDLVYRPHREGDFPKLQRVWQQSSGWGTLKETFWKRHVVEAPNGSPFICVVDSGDEVIGALAFQRMRLLVDGREVKAARPIAPIVSQELRSRAFSLNPLDHPVVKMVMHTTRLLKEEGFALTYMLPDPHWKLLFRMMPRVSHASFPLWSLPLPLAEPFGTGAGYEVGPLTELGEPVDRLWARASAGLGCSVIRDARRLRYSAGPPEYDVLGVRKAGELVGLVSSRRKGDRQWLICDMLAADDEALRETLAGACNLAHRKALSGEAGPLIKAALLVTPGLAPAARSLGFQRDRYDFTLVTRILDDTLRPEHVEPARWYLSAND